MKAKIQKWGDSLAVRIPESFAEEAQLEQGMLVEVILMEGKLAILPAAQPIYQLEDLLADVTDDNLHLKIDFGGAVGKEIL